MKTLKIKSFAIAALVVLASCNNDDDNTPELINEEEVITTMTVTLTSTGNNDVITLKTQDLDGDGPNEPVVSVSSNLVAGTIYNGSITVENETVSPAEDITEEVIEEAEEHQFFYTPDANLDITTAYTSLDSNGDNLGTTFTLTANQASTGNLTITLRHLPTKPNTGIDDAGGETDITASFNIEIQ